LEKRWGGRGAGTPAPKKQEPFGKIFKGRKGYLNISVTRNITKEAIAITIPIATCRS